MSTLLNSTCPKCGLSAAPSDLYCGGCGSALAPASKEASPSPQAQPHKALVAETPTRRSGFEWLGFAGACLGGVSTLMALGFVVASFADPSTTLASVVAPLSLVGLGVGLPTVAVAAYARRSRALGAAALLFLGALAVGAARFEQLEGEGSTFVQGTYRLRHGPTYEEMAFVGGMVDLRDSSGHSTLVPYTRKGDRVRVSPAPAAGVPRSTSFLLVAGGRVLVGPEGSPSTVRFNRL